jgi:predicted nuclease with RNAse H fold
MEAELATLYLMLGIAKSALSIFERLEFWPEVIECYQVAKEDDKALEVIKERIAKTGETPEFLCFLGDLQRDKKERIASYTKAWILSKGRFSKAKRQLGVIAMQEQRVRSSLSVFVFFVLFFFFAYLSLT